MDKEKEIIEEEVWVLVSPDNENYDAAFAIRIINSLAKKYNVKFTGTTKKRDCGHGLERMGIVCGTEENVRWFCDELDEQLA